MILIASIRKQLRDYAFRLRAYTTRELVNRFALVIVIGVFLSLTTSFFLLRAESEAIQTLLSVVFMSSINVLSLGLFMIGLALFVRKENPYTVSHEFFGIRLLAYGLVPRTVGFLAMALSLSSLTVSSIMIVVNVLWLIRSAFGI